MEACNYHQTGMSPFIYVAALSLMTSPSDLIGYPGSARRPERERPSTKRCLHDVQVRIVSYILLVLPAYCAPGTTRSHTSTSPSCSDFVARTNCCQQQANQAASTRERTQVTRRVLGILLDIFRRRLMRGMGQRWDPW